MLCIRRAIGPVSTKKGEVIRGLPRPFFEECISSIFLKEGAKRFISLKKYSFFEEFKELRPQKLAEESKDASVEAITSLSARPAKVSMLLKR